MMSPELTALVVVVTLILQTWYQRWASKEDKKEIKAEAQAVAVKTEATAQIVTEKLDTVHKTINGEGLGGKLDKALEWQAAHDAQDNERYDHVMAELLRLRGKAPEDKA